MHKIAVLDVDGTLLDWINPFRTWCSQFSVPLLKETCEEQYDIETNYLSPTDLMSMFNQTTHISHLPPLPNAKRGVQALLDCGYHIHICTAFSNNYNQVKMREQNLINMFGNVFADITALPVNSSKKDYLEYVFAPYSGVDAILVEDSVRVLREGSGDKFDLIDYYTRFMIKQPWNTKHTDEMLESGVNIVTDWSEIIKYFKKG